jgi:PhoH-like ATPase
VVVVPITVLEEMDRFKKDLTEIGRNARHFSRYLDEIRKRGSLTNGVEIGKKGTLIVDLFRDAEKYLPSDMAHEKNDHKILAVALKFRQEKTNTSVVFVTKDVNLRVKADALGINSVDYEPSRVSIDELYTGMITMDVPSDVVDKFLLDKRLPVQQPELFANSYVTLKDQKDY